MPLFTTRVHSVLDYASALTLPVLPRALGWDGPVKTACDSAALAALGYSLCTDYEGGVAKQLSMPTHLRLDAVWGASLLAAGASLTRAPRAARLTLAAFGVVGIVASLTTETAPRAPHPGY